MSNLKAQYSVIEEDGEFFIYDHEQDATVNRWGDVVDEGLFTMSEALATINFLEGKAPPQDSGLKTFQIDSYDYQAEDCIQGIFINPVLPENFWTEPLEERTEEDMRLWQDLPFIISDNDFYKIYCLNGGAWDRPSLIGGFDSQDKAVDFIVETYRK